jgi:hypothetical protein
MEMSSAVRFGWGSKGTARGGGGSNQSQIIESSMCEHWHQLFYISRFINSIKFYYSILFFYFFIFLLLFYRKKIGIFQPQKKGNFFSQFYTRKTLYIYIYIYIYTQFLGPKNDKFCQQNTKKSLLVAF